MVEFEELNTKVLEKKSGVLSSVINNAFVFYFSLTCLVIAFVLVTNFNGLYGQDAHEYFRYSKALHEFFRTGNNPGDYFWPVLYPLFGAIVSVLLPNLFALQLISIASFIIAILVLEKLIELLYQGEKTETRIYLLVFFFLSPYALRASTVVMSDMLAVVFSVTSIYFFYKFWYFRRPIHFVALIFFASFATATRYASFVIVIIPVLIASLKFLRSFNIMFFLLATGSTILAFIPHLLIRHSNPTDFIQQSWISDWSIRNFFKTSFTTVNGSAKYTFPNIFYCIFNWIHPAFILVGAPVFLFGRKNSFKRITVKILLIVVYGYSFFLAGIPFQNLRFLILSFPLVLVLLFPLTIDFFKKMHSVRWALIIVTIMQIGLFIRVLIPFYYYNQLEKAISFEIKNYSINQPIFTFEMESALYSYGVKNKIIGLGEERLDSFPSNSLLLFNEQRFSSQWNELPTMKNYNRIKQTRKIIPLKRFDNGWQLSEIE